MLFRCEQISVRHYMDSTYGWENLVVGGIDVIDLPGDHVAIFEEPVVFTLAHELSARLQSVTSDQCSTWPTTSFHLPDKSCRLRQSTQHSSEVYARESGTGHTNFNPSDGRALRVRVPRHRASAAFISPRLRSSLYRDFGLQTLQLLSRCGQQIVKNCLVHFVLVRYRHLDQSPDLRRQEREGKL